MKVIVCNECDAEFKVKHGMDESYYRVEWCVFCGNELSEENKDEIESPEWSAYDDNEKDDHIHLTIRTFWFILHIVTCCAIILNAWRHW